MELYDRIQDMYEKNQVSEFELIALEEVCATYDYVDAQEIEIKLDRERAYDREKALEIIREHPLYMEVLTSVLDPKELFIVQTAGVYDRTTKAFYKCGYGEHFKCIGILIKNYHPQYFPAFEALRRQSKLEEFEGVTIEQLDTFIIDNFHLLGASLKASECMNLFGGDI